MHFSFDRTVTSASWSVDAGLPPEEVSPHPVTVATWPVYRDWVEAARQMIPMVEEKVRGVLRNSIE